MRPVLDVLLFIFLGGVVIVSTAPVWGPVLLALVLPFTVLAAWRRLRPTGRHRGPGTPARTCPRTSADTGPDPDADHPLICTDTYPDVSADTDPDLSGHDDAGER